MTRVLLTAVVAAMVIPFPVRAQGKPDFTGTWTMDAAKSDPPPQGRGGRGGGMGGGTLTIKQTGTDLTVTSEGRQGPQTMTYKLDGSPSSNEVMGRGGAQTVKSTAKWDGATLVIEMTRDFNGMTITTKEIRTLSADGTVMTIESTSQTPQGEVKRKVVYTKS